MGDAPKVAILMGSDTDLQVMEEAVEALEKFHVPFEMRVLSAHRSAEALEKFAREAESKGVQVLIAAAGGAAHLAGVLASHTALPVIGVPMPSDRMGGMDSLLSTVQMPAGVPVACMGLGKSGATNAAVMAVEVLATADPHMRKALREYKKELSEQVKAQDGSVQRWLKDRTTQ